jgi:hypothetical protein
MQVTMKAAVVRSFGKPLAIEDVPIPTPGPGEVQEPAASATPICTPPPAIGRSSRRFPSFRVTRPPGSWPRSGRGSTL